ncbi:MAG TPA: hypothetical protein VD766_13810 [Solirubrobacterales bacterium]|nr:hypothetical protein [Solirubrobacterales bacterium]
MRGVRLALELAVESPGIERQQPAGGDAVALRRNLTVPEGRFFQPLETCVPGVFAIGDLRHRSSRLAI